MDANPQAATPKRWHRGGACVSYIWLIYLSTCVTSYGAEVLVPSNSLQLEDSADYFVISVGVNVYQDKFWPALKWPASDAGKITAHLGRDTEHAVHKFLLVDEQATLDNIYATLNDVAQQATSADTVILYISSHGTLAPDSAGALERITVVNDTDHTRLHATGLLHHTLQDWLDRLPARKKLLIFATCHSGEGKSQLPQSVLKLVQSRKGKLAPLAEASEGSLILAAAAQGEAAREDDGLQGDIYTYFLVEALATYDRNRDGVVSALEAHDYAKEKTWAFTQGRQRPTAHARFIGDADINLVGRKERTGLPVLEAYDERLAGFQVLVDGNAKGVLPFAFPLNAQGSRISLFAPDAREPLASYFVTAAPGDILTLEQVMTERPLAFSMNHRRYLWQNQAWRRLTGNRYSTASELGAGYAAGRVTAGIASEYIAPAGNNIAPLIRSDAALWSTLFQVSYRLPISRFAVTGALEAGSEHIDVKLRDRSNGDALRFQDDAWSSGVTLAASYELGYDLSLVLNTGMKKTAWRLNTLGTVNGDRHWLGLGLEYRFGWRARSLQ